MMKHVLHCTIIALFFSACNTHNLLKFKQYRYYAEISRFERDSNNLPHLTNRISYNVPSSIDEEHSYYLNLNFKDTLRAIEMKKIDLVKDTSIVISDYGVFSIWNWDNEDNKISGTIEILKWESNSITLHENVVVDDFRRKEKKKFVGIRTFKLEK